ncbi:MAG: methyltransferase [Porticoccaceae bacterium]|nr:methyltransferase [Porticoccaceae bacterium]
MSVLINQPALAELPVLNGRQFRLWEDMLENRIGVRVAKRQGYICSEISKRMIEGGWGDADSYFRDVLGTLAGAREWGILLDRLLVKETQFFRHQPSHDYVRARVTSLVTPNSGISSRSAFNIWSAGCASGEEAYSLAIQAAEGFAAAGQPENYYIVGTDVSADAIASAREGIYSNSALEQSPSMLKEKYFSPPDGGKRQVASAVRQRVAFSIANLLEKQTRYNNYLDLIYCQNVLVYFKHWRRREIVKNFQACLKPGGCLIIGPGELTDWVPDNMRRLDVPGVQAYEKRRKQ